MQTLDIETFAKIKDVPIFRAGTHNGLTFSDADIDNIVNASNEVLPFIQESIQAGAYRENPHLESVKSIPALLNLGHGRFLPDSLKELVKDVSVKFQRQGEWITATFENVKSDVAEFLRARFPLRSVELIPSLFNPMTGKTYKNVIRSVAFLPGDIPPAVAGQSADLAIEFEQQPILTVVSKFEEEQTTMKDEITGAEMDAQKEADHVAMFAELQAQIKDVKARLSKTEQEKAVIEKRLSDAETTNRVKDIEAFCAKLTHEGGASPAFIAKVRPLLIQKTNGVISFSATPESLEEFAEWVIQNTDSVKVAIGEFAKAEAEHPQNLSIEQKRQAALESVAKERGLSLTDNYSQVWRFAAEKHAELFV